MAYDSLVPEDGTGLTDANSYCTLEFANDFLALDTRKHDWFLLDDTHRENLLMVAAETLDNYYTWVGAKAVATSGLSFPRTGVYDREGTELASDSVPVQLQKANAILAHFLKDNDPFEIAVGSGISRLKVDVIDIRFDKNLLAHPLPLQVRSLCGMLGRLPDRRKVQQIPVV